MHVSENVLNVTSLFFVQTLNFICICPDVYKGVILLPSCVILKNSARYSIAFLRILGLQVLYASLKRKGML